MERELICLNSDTVNRNGFRFIAGSLEQAIKQNLTGLPMCVNHDRHRVLGITYPFALYFEPHITRLLGLQVTANNQQEQEQINNVHQYHISKKNREGFEPYQEKFFELIGQFITENHRRISTGCAAVCDEGICLKIFPKFFDLMDDAGLIPLSVILKDFIYQGQGVFKHRTSDLSIFAHRDFRRSQSIYNNFHFYFLDELINLSSKQDITIKLCIDEDLIGYAPSYNDGMELAYHFGPKFNDDISSLKMGVTRHESGEFQKIFSCIYSTEFYWKEDANERTFEMEELRSSPAPNLDEETYNCRYMHSIYDTSKQEFFHFDGAIRSYDLEAMSDRLDKSFIEYGRKAAYKKLFRIDGKLPLNKWKLLVIHYMQDNPLVYEYFGLTAEMEQLKLHPKELEQEKKLIPFSIKKESGIRLLVSYHNLPEDLKEGRYIEIFDVIGTGTEKFDCAEHIVYEIKKALLNLGEDLEIPENIYMLKIMDRYLNIPSIMHSGPNAYNLLLKSIEAYKLLFSSMSQAGLDVDIAFTFSFVLNDKVVRVSSYGHIDSLLNWMNENLPFPNQEKEFTKWIDKQRKYLEAFPESSDDPLISSLVQFDGVIYLKRKSMDYPFEIFEDERGVGFTIQWPKNKNEILNLVNTKVVEPKVLIRLLKMQWSDTGEDYFTSSRSKWLDRVPHTGVEITECEALSMYWTKS